MKKKSSVILLPIYFIYLFLERREGREKKRERNINVWSVASRTPPTGDQPATQACAPTGNQTSDLSVCRSVLNLLSHTGHGPISLCTICFNFLKLFDSSLSTWCLGLCKDIPVAFFCLPHLFYWALSWTSPSEESHHLVVETSVTALIISPTPFLSVYYYF